MTLNVYYQNVRGLRTKLKDFKLNVNANSHDIILITESWLHSGIFDSEIVDLSEYSIFRRDRGSTSSGKIEGGGVFIAVKNYLKPSSIQGFQSDAEDAWAQISLGNHKISLCCVYLPPGNKESASYFTTKLESLKKNVRMFHMQKGCLLFAPIYR